MSKPLVQIQPSILIELKDVHRIRDFVKNYLNDINLESMFVKTAAPKPEGTCVRFRFDYNSGKNTCELEGIVIRALSGPQAIDDIPGMEVRFGRMEITTRAVLRKVIMEFLDQHGYPEPVNLNDPRKPKLIVANPDSPPEVS